eukprot:COSAG02_NODE_2118_length_9784_cov_337.366649_3_plen_398_part_00
MVVLDFLGQGQRAAPPQSAKKSPKPPSDEFATHRAMILENGPSPRHERTFLAKLDAINKRDGSMPPIRFSKQFCGGSNRNGAVFSPRNIATPPEIDAAMSALQSERLRAAIAEARSARAKPPPRYRQYEVLGKPLPKEARCTPQPIEPALNLTTSHIVGTVKQRGDNHLPVLPRVKVPDENTVRKLRASAFAAFKRDEPSSGARSERAAAAESSARRRLKRIADGPSSSRSESKTAATERSARRRRRRLQAAEAAASTASRNESSGTVAAEASARPAARPVAAKVAQTTTVRTNAVKEPHPPPDPRFPPRPAEKPPENKRGEKGVPAGASSWEMGQKHPGVPKDPASPRRKPPLNPSTGSPRRSTQQMMSTVDRKSKLAHLEKQIESSNSELLQTLS